MPSIPPTSFSSPSTPCEPQFSGCLSAFKRSKRNQLDTFNGKQSDAKPLKENKETRRERWARLWEEFRESSGSSVPAEWHTSLG